MSNWRKPRFLSPSALGTWKFNQEHYFLKYLASNRPPRDPQTRPMSVGSSFDAYCKSALANDFALESKQFVLETIFETQVEEHNRDFAWEAGKNCFEQYKNCGAYNSLVQFLMKCTGEIKMEFSGEQTFDNGVTLLGKPDLYVTYEGVRVIPDWKVNGYCSTAPVSPAKGYVNLFDMWGNKHGNSHASAHLAYFKDICHDSSENLVLEKPEWSRQLATYCWVNGGDVGTPFIGWIEQLAVGRDQQVRVARHVSFINPAFQRAVFTEFSALWEIVQSNHIFRHLSFEASQERCEILNKQAAAYAGDTVQDSWFTTMMKGGK